MAVQTPIPGSLVQNVGGQPQVVQRSSYIRCKRCPLGVGVTLVKKDQNRSVSVMMDGMELQAGAEQGLTVWLAQVRREQVRAGCRRPKSRYEALTRILFHRQLGDQT